MIVKLECVVFMASIQALYVKMCIRSSACNDTKQAQHQNTGSHDFRSSRACKQQEEKNKENKPIIPAAGNDCHQYTAQTQSDPRSPLLTRDSCAQSKTDEQADCDEYPVLIRIGSWLLVQIDNHRSHGKEDGRDKKKKERGEVFFVYKPDRKRGENGGKVDPRLGIKSRNCSTENQKWDGDGNGQGAAEKY